MNTGGLMILVTSLVAFADGYEWAPPQNCFSRKLTFISDSSDVKTEIASLRKEIEQTCNNQSSYQQLLVEIQLLNQKCNNSTNKEQIM